MAKACRLSVATTGAFLHPLEQTAIDARYGEAVATERLPERRFLSVAQRQLLDFGLLPNVRLVVVTNMSGADMTVQPTTEEADLLARKVLLVGVLPAADAQGILDSGAIGWLSLPPCTAERRSQGGSQLLWLAPGTRVALAANDPRLTVTARVLLFPGNETPDKPA